MQCQPHLYPILKAKLEAVWADIPAEDVRASSAWVQMQLWAIVAKRGGCVENSFNKSYSVLPNEIMFKMKI